MAQLYIPKLKDKLRLTVPLVLNADELNMDYGSDNRPTMYAINFPGEAWNWQKSDKMVSAELEIGTVLAVRRYHVSVHAKTNDVQVSIFAHPRHDLTPRAQGGASKMLKLVLPIEVMNRIHYEKLDV